MSREIEFRAYNKNTGVMLSNVPVCHGNAMTWRMATKSSPVITLEGKDGVTNFYCDWDFLKEEPHLIVDQYTGLKDCNGVKIFEGDIVRDHNGVGEVQYSEKKASFKVNYHNGFSKWFIDYNLVGERESIKVIGNIHQNPELLEQSK